MPLLLRDITFESWEDNLPWVKEYKKLLSKEVLSQDDCFLLPKMRVGAIGDYVTQLSVRAPALNVDYCQTKFQQAIDNLIHRFCVPIEEKYKEILDHLEQKLPERKDHELLSDALKEDVLKASQLRYVAKYDVGFALKPLRQSAHDVQKLNPKNIEVAFQQNRDKFKQRYSQLLKEEIKVLQNRFSELQKQESALEKQCVENEALIVELTKGISKEKAEIESLLEKAKPRTHLNISSPDAPMLGAPPPPPPPPPPVSLFGQVSFSPMSQDKPTAQSSTSFSVSPELLKSARLRRVPVSDTTVGVSAPAFVKATGVQGKTSGDTSPARARTVSSASIVSGEVLIDDMQNTLRTNAIKIYQKEHLIEAMTSRQKEQDKIIEMLQKQQKSIQSLLMQMKAWDAKKMSDVVAKEAAEALAVPATESLGFIPPAPPSPPVPGMFAPAPPPPPVLSISAAKMTKVSAPTKQFVDSSKEVNPSTDHMEALKKSLSLRRMHLDSDDENKPDSDDEWGARSSVREAEAAKQRIKEETQRAILSKYGMVAADAVDKMSDNDRTKMLAESHAIVKKEKQLSARFESNPVQLEQLKRQVDRTIEDESALDVSVSVTPANVVRVVDSIVQPDDVITDFGPADEDISVAPPEGPQLSVGEQALSAYLNTHRERLHLDQEAIDFIMCDGLLINPMNRVDPACLTNSVLQDLLKLHQFYQVKKMDLLRPNKLSAELIAIYDASLDGFYQEAIEIRLSGSALQLQRAEMIEAANKHFEARHTVERAVADAALFVGTLSVGTLLIGGARRALGHTFFMSQEKSARYREFERLLKPSELCCDGGEENGLFNFR